MSALQRRLALFRSSARRIVARGDLDRLPIEYVLKRLTVDFKKLDRPAWYSVIKDADYKPTSVPRKRIKVGTVLFEDRPMRMWMVSVYDVAPAVAAIVIIWIDFP